MINKKRIYTIVIFGAAGIVGLFTLGSTLPTTPVGGNISISVKLIGPVPENAQLKVPESTCHHIVQDESLIIDSLKGIKNVMLYLKDIEGKVSGADYTLNNEGCVFVPHAGFANVGGRLVMTNEDNLMHNVHAYFVVDDSKRTIINTTLPNKGSKMVNTTVFNNPGFIEVKCDAHPWMAAIIRVMNHPYYSLTGAGGNGEIQNVPAGEYEMVVYHETLGQQIKRVKVVAGKTITISVSMSK